jgi:hypothetical protein
MTRAHRRFHRVLWPVLAVLITLGITMALVLRPPPDDDEDPQETTEQTR